MKKSLSILLLFFYSFSFLKNKLFVSRLFFFLLFFACFSFNSSAQLTNVFSDNFDRGSGSSSSLTTSFTGGTPTASYNQTTTSTGTGRGCVARLNQYVTTNYSLQLMGPDSMFINQTAAAVGSTPDLKANSVAGSNILQLTAAPNPAIIPTVSPFYAVNFPGVPSGTYVTAFSGTTVTMSAAATTTNSNTLVSFINNGSNQSNGSVFTSASTSVYSSPFTNVLSNTVGDVIWNFTMKTNRSTAFSNNSLPWTGNKFGAATIIGCTNSIFSGAGAGNGYAVVMQKGTTANTLKLIRFVGGLLGTQTVLATSSGDFMTSNTEYVSVKVVFSPAGNTWKLFAREDATTMNTDFTTVTSQLGSTIQDSTYTRSSTPLTNFGFFWIYGNNSTYSSNNYSSSNTIYFDNYNVFVDKSNYTLSTNSLNFLNTEVGANSAIKSVVIDGSNLDANLVLTPPANFQISADSATFVTNPSTLSIPTTSGTLTGKKIYVRYSPTGYGGYTGDIVFPKSNTKISLSGYIRTFYYNIGSGLKVDTLPYWRAIAADVVSSNTPLDFSHDSVLYKIIGPSAPSQISTNRTWTISGIGTKIVLGDPAYPPIKLVDSITINTVSPVVLDIAKSNDPTKGNSLYMKATDTLLNFGELDSISEVHYVVSPLYNYVQSPNFGKLFAKNKDDA